MITKKDDDGHTYKIPEQLENRFDELMDATLNVKFATPEWYDAVDVFNGEFFGYMVG